MKLATLLYIRNTKGDYLLIERLKQPNNGRLSPPGGKLLIKDAESPVACAVREAEEECGIISNFDDWTLLGIISEKEYPDIGNIMIFAFLYNKTLDVLPSSIDEGTFSFVNPDNFQNSNIPETDKLYIWKFVLNHNLSPFSVYIDCTDKDNYKCTVEQK